MSRRTLAAALVATLVASACGGGSGPTGPTEMSISDGFGSYDVGVETITIMDASGGDRDLTVDVWFPLKDSSGLAPWQQVLPGDLVFESTHAFDATSSDMASDGPFPLVIYSHGGAAVRNSDSNYAEAIASHGYIVAAPDHLGDTALDSSDDLDTKLFNRPNDVSAVIDAMVDIDITEFATGVNDGQVAVTGFEAFTVYATASGFENQRGEYLADERVGAIIALNPQVFYLGDERLARIKIPSLVMIGTNDVAASATRPWELSNSSPSYRVDLVGGEHLSFTNVCAYLALLDANPEAPAGGFRDMMNGIRGNGCEPDDFPFERARDITNTFATAFLDSVFRGTDPISADQVAGQNDLVYRAK